MEIRYSTQESQEIPRILWNPKVHYRVSKYPPRGGAVVWGTALQAGRSRVRFPMVSLEFFIDTIPPATLMPWGWLNL